MSTSCLPIRQRGFSLIKRCKAKRKKSQSKFTIQTVVLVLNFSQSFVSALHSLGTLSSELSSLWLLMLLEPQCWKTSNSILVEMVSYSNSPSRLIPGLCGDDTRHLVLVFMFLLNARSCFPVISPPPNMRHFWGNFMTCHFYKYSFSDDIM